MERAALEVIEKSVGDVFGFDVRRTASLDDSEVALDPARGQHNSMILLARLSEQVPADAARVLGVTDKDIFIPVLSFVFGQAQLNGRIAIVSLARLRQEFYGLSPDEGLFLDRSAKESLHELGHTFGLIHCADLRCVMSLSTTIAQVDAKTSRFCESCRASLDERVEAARAELNVRESKGGLK